MLCSTVTNRAVAVEQSNAEEVMVAMMENDNKEERQEASSTTVNSTVLKHKRMSKKQEYQAELNDHILQIAEKEDQVNLELAAIGPHIKRKLNKGEIEEILDEIKDLTRDFLNRK